MAEAWEAFRVRRVTLGMPAPVSEEIRRAYMVGALDALLQVQERPREAVVGELLTLIRETSAKVPS